ncbi:MAG: RNA polymerase sporulation sigma factor SigH [Euzebyales bacterium]|nr:RNA polymerase sporulation sigma factor SigH [Euzebyales bacterium]
MRDAASRSTSQSPAATATDEELVLRSWEGDDAALDSLLERYRGVVRLKARSYFLIGADREDVVQEGMIGLYKAIRDYDPGKEAGFRGFAELCVTRQIITAVKIATRQKHAPLNSYLSLNVPAYHDDEPDTELIEHIVSNIADPADDVISGAEMAVLEEYFSEILSDLEADVLRRYVEGHSYEEIAGELDRHVKSIDNALQRIKRKLEGYLAERGVDSAVS